MNLHFSNDVSSYPREIPRKVFARIDSVDEIDEETVVIGLDAVSQESAERAFTASSSEAWSALWLEAFEARGERTTSATELIGEQRLYHIEIRQPRNDARLIQESGALNSASLGWITLDLNPSGMVDGIPAAVFAGLFSEAIQVQLANIKAVEPGVAESLMAVFSMRSWPTVSINDVGAELSDVDASYWAAYDVGQGSANGLLRSNGQVSLFHDIGCGVYRNASTRPNNLILCNSHEAPIILSHWDTDHWAGARYFAPSSKPNAFLERTWLAPHDLTIGPRHIAFASSILAVGGKLILIKPGAVKSRAYRLSSGRSLSLIRGGGVDRNGSGIAMEIVDFSCQSRRWLITGDVSYQHLSPHISSSYVAMSVPHHGSKFDTSVSIPIPAGTDGYSRLIYSFGANNSFGHPKLECVTQHVQAGWAHPGWTSSSQIAIGIAGGSVIATACHHPGSDHLGAILVGWNCPPKIPYSLRCNGQCNASLVQS